MRFLTALVLLATLLAAGCGPQGASEETANRISEMEKRINEQQMKENPPPPGEGPAD
jgi:outer membrane lipoprotein-sorting protein